ncbi:GL22030 [Drosophila persimilis]|uniref:GL22030 n=1 Tax=Drosophila persimilis TaxID=7234 RepID=B4GEK4_DROPE|nr:GL22030 [Drosophila persimilis]
MYLGYVLLFILPVLCSTASTFNYTSCDKAKQPKFCIAECAFKANGYLLTNGSVNVAALQKTYQQRYKNDANMSQLMVRSLNSCVDYAQKRTQQYQWMHTKDECDYYPATLLACILEQVYTNCPATKWKNTDECAAMRKYLLACDDVKSGRK